MALPQQVQAALDAADATLAAVNAPANPASDLSDDGQGNQGDAFAVAPPAPDPVVPAVPSPPVAPEGSQTPQNDVWEQRYRVLQGKYDAEVPQLHRRVHGLEANLNEAVERLNKVSEQRTPEPPKATDPQDVENFGADLVNFVGRIAGQAVANAMPQFQAKTEMLEAQIGQLVKQLEGTHQQVAQSSEQLFFSNLSKLVPTWEQINADQGFLTWLAEADPVYGVPRQQALIAAQRALDVNRVAAVFNAYAVPRQPAPAPDPLANQVSPKSSATPTPAPVSKPIIKQGDVTKFYDDLRRGVYRGNDAEAQRIEQIINTALAEGRVQ